MPDWRSNKLALRLGSTVGVAQWDEDVAIQELVCLNCGGGIRSRMHPPDSSDKPVLSLESNSGAETWLELEEGLLLPAKTCAHFLRK